jgi:hypothetical protein
MRGKIPRNGVSSPTYPYKPKINTMQSINYPCVMVEEQNMTKGNPLNSFVIIRKAKEIKKYLNRFNEPLLCHHYSIINEALRIEAHFNYLAK